ncbi:hypothetical protein HYPSUDRAFT_43099 [Hypholoma sublateritium FD-334 SS-4]|uniref:Uncharacterized protein n=1 Tax=Hypholoma sublateritium (strain FD-334 SS-4) TaxID=945553 RepID=A0A0D2PKW4_HYPSF|nr:hypothetical protein HYPSUDRAFT_43099 [Hypholoma sublateritium FD-334 SS-4]
MEKRAKNSVFQDRSNTLSSLSYCPDSPTISSKRLRTYDTGVISIMPTKPSFQHISSEPRDSSPTTTVIEDMNEAYSHGRTITDLFESTSTDYEAMRAARYSKAEQALAETVQYSLQQSSSIRELQMNALKEATSLLNAHIVDAKERLEKLRPILINRQVEPDVFRSMLHQRWMDERNLYAAEQLSKALEDHLATLASNPMPFASTCATKPSNAKLNAAKNLERFFDSPLQKVQVRNRVRRCIGPASQPRQEKKPDFPRIHHHRHLLSLKLKPPDMRLSFVKPYTTNHVKVITAPPPLPPLPPTPIPEVPEIDCSSTPSISGTATIWYSSPRSTEEILEGLVVSMPDYVSGLLANLDTAAPPQLTTPPARCLAAPHSAETILPVRPVPGAHVPAVLHKSSSRRRLSAMLPGALSSRMGPPASRVLPASKRFNSPPPSGFQRCMHIHAEPMSEEHAAPQLAGRVSFSASHLPDIVGSKPEADVVPYASQVALGGGNSRIVARLRRRISILRGKP